MKNLLKLLFISLFFVQLSPVPAPSEHYKLVHKVNTLLEKTTHEKAKDSADKQLQTINDNFVRANMMFDAYKAYGVEDDFIVAKQEFKKVANQDQNLVFKAKAICKLGDVYLLKRYIQKAIRNFHLVAELDHGSIALKAEANYKLGEIYLKKNELDKALYHFSMVANQTKDFALQIKAICKLGDIYLLNGDAKKARVNFHLVADLQHGDLILKAEANYNLGEICLEQKEFEKAVYHFSLAAKQNTNEDFQPKALEGLAEAHYALGKEFLLKKDFDKAIHHLDLAANQDISDDIKIKSSFLLAGMYMEYNAIKFTDAKNYIIRAYECAKGTYKKINRKIVKVATGGDTPNKEQLVELLNNIIKHRNKLGKAIKEQFENANNIVIADNSNKNSAKDIARLIMKF